MPKKYGYRTGGKHEPGALSTYEDGSGDGVEVTMAGAGKGTGWPRPDEAISGNPVKGTGSSGTKSTSSES